MATSALERHRYTSPLRHRRPETGRSGRRTWLAAVERLEGRTLLASNWTALANQAPTEIQTMELLTNGTVMASTYSNQWYLLTPSAKGSYINGTWSQLANEPVDRLYVGTTVEQSGNVFVLGGEYINGNDAWSNTGETYDPNTNSWSAVANFPQSNFGDDPTVLLENGDILAGFLGGPQTYLYNIATNSWTQTGTKNNNDRSDEEGWVKLPDDSILSYDVWYENGAATGLAQRYIPSTGTWVNTGTVPVALSEGSEFELGPNGLLPNGDVIQVGDNGNTAIFNPSSDTTSGGGTWTAGPVVPGGYVSDDAAGVVLPDGQFIFTADKPNYNTPTHVFDYDYKTNTITDITPTTGNGDPSDLVSQLAGTPSYTDRFLMLPTGQALFTAGGDTQLYVYTGTGPVNAASTPSITDVTANGSNSYTLTGSALNGATEGASYGDDAQMATNYPIVSVATDISTTYYATTTDWNKTGVGVTNGATSVEFALPSAISTAPVVTLATLNPSFGQYLDNVTVATFTDPNGNFTGDYTATITWGDGAVTTGTITGPTGGGVYTVTGSHAYFAPGPENFSVNIVDKYASGELSVSGSGVSSAPVAFTLSGNGSTTIDVTGSSLATSTGVVSSFNPSVYGQGMTFVASVNDTLGNILPTGTVAFYDGANEIGTGTAVRGTGTTVKSTFSTSSLTAGMHTIMAVFTATGYFAGSNGSMNMQVSPALITVSGITAANKMYDDTTTATLNMDSATLSGVLVGDTVTLNTGAGTGTFATRDVGNGIAVTVAGLSLGGAQANDYTLVQPTLSANITPASLTVSGITAATKMYNASTNASIGTGFAALVGVFDGDTVNLNTGAATGTFATDSVGTGIPVIISGLTISGPQAGDYTLTDPSTTADITAAPLTVSGITAANKVYDASATATLNTASAALVGVLGSDAVKLGTSVAIGTFATQNAGTGLAVTVSGLTISGAQAGDYTLTQPTTTASITSAALTISGITAEDKVFDGTTAATLGTAPAALIGVLLGDTVNLDTADSTGTFAAGTVGTAIPVTISGLTLTGPEAGDYSLTLPTTTASIMQATPTVGISSSGGIYSGSAFSAAATVSGVSGVPGSTLEGVGLTTVYYAGDTATGTPLSAAPITVGTYTVVASFPGSADYSAATSLPVTVMIGKATPTVNISAASGTYNGTAFGAVSTVAGVSGKAASALETVGLTTVYYAGSTATGTPLASAPIGAGTYTAVASFAGSANYTGNTSQPITYAIAKATPALRLAASGGEFDGSSFAGAATVAGIGNTYSASLEGVTPALTYYVGSGTSGTSLSATAPTVAGTYTVVAAFASSADYSSAVSSPVTFTIRPGTTTLALTSSTGSAAFGQSLTFVANVTAPATPGGYVQFFDDGNSLGAVLLNGSSAASLTTSSLRVGAHSITATYSGDANLVGANAGPAVTSVGKAGSRVLLTPKPVLKKKKIVSEVLTANVASTSAGAGVPTGSVMFELVTKKKKTSKTTLLGTAAISGGTAAPLGQGQARARPGDHGRLQRRPDFPGEHFDFAEGVEEGADLSGSPLRYRRYPARPRYSPVRVSTRTVTPWSRCSGTWTTTPGRQRGGLGAAGRRVAAHARGGLDDRQLDRIRQLDGDHLVVDHQRLDPLHVFGHERHLVAQLVERQRELVERCRVHEVERVRIAVKVLDRPALEARLVERIGPAVRLLDPGLGLQVARLDLVERGRAAGRRGLNLDLLDHVRRAVDLDDHPALEVLGGNHGDASLPRFADRWCH